MRARDFIPQNKKEKVDEFLPVLGAAAGALGRGAAALGGAALRGGAALGRGIGNAVTQGANALGQVAGQAASGVASGLAAGGSTPQATQAIAAQSAQDKRQVQTIVKQKEDELLALKQQLSKMP
jgi:hypothetical protein